MHRHIWKIVQKEILPSMMEQIEKMHPTKFGGLQSSFARKDVIVTYLCIGCTSKKIVRI